MVIKEGWKLIQLTLHDCWKFAEAWAFEHVFITIGYDVIAPVAHFLTQQLYLMKSFYEATEHTNNILSNLDISFRFCIEYWRIWTNLHIDEAFLKNNRFYSHFFLNMEVRVWENTEIRSQCWNWSLLQSTF